MLPGFGMKTQQNLQDVEPPQATIRTDAEIASLSARALQLESIPQNIEFRQVWDITKQYRIGKNVLDGSEDSLTVGKAVLYGKRIGDNKRVILKRRGRLHGFKDSTEVKEWILITKLLYALSGGASQSAPGAGGKLKLIANMTDIVEDERNLYAVMEHVEGRDLFDFFAQEQLHEQPYRNKLAAQIARMVTAGVEELHRLGLMHLDLKLENIVLQESAQKQKGPELQVPLQIIDFDTVEIYKPQFSCYYVLGTDQYIPPESYLGQPEPVSDMWAVGVITYILLTGTFPFRNSLFVDQVGENFVGHPKMNRMAIVLKAAVINYSHSIWREDPRAKDFVKRCLCPDPNGRLTAAQGLAHPWIREIRFTPNLERLVTAPFRRKSDAAPEGSR